MFGYLSFDQSLTMNVGLIRVILSSELKQGWIMVLSNLVSNQATPLGPWLRTRKILHDLTRKREFKSSRFIKFCKRWTLHHIQYIVFFFFSFLTLLESNTCPQTYTCPCSEPTQLQTGLSTALGLFSIIFLTYFSAFI